MRILLIIPLILGCSRGVKTWPAMISLNDKAPNYLIQHLKDLNNRTQKRIISENENAFLIHIFIVKDDLINERSLGIATKFEDYCDIHLSQRAINYSDLLKTVIWHEIGHCFGLHHDDTQGEIMYYIASPFTEYSESAIMRFISQLSY